LPPVAHLAMAAHTESSARLLRELLARGNAPTALFCSNDLLAASVIAQLAALRVRVPDDIAVCGFDGVSIGALMVPPLCTVEQPSRQIGATACALLLARLGGETPASVRLPHRLIQGGTAAPLAHPVPSSRKRSS
ncbi:substrate-binding domain-containing protein, partial [Bordetella petrii]|uniref:substrate-binding domain-containing protein n=1 Tax=Bordetella petrii TaxID=94624 RepID=UPI001E36234F